MQMLSGYNDDFHKTGFIFGLLVLLANAVYAQTTSLNGEWKALVDPAAAGDRLQVWLAGKPQHKTDFFEYSFTGAPVLKVPGDFNSQRSELTYYEGTVWYNRQFNYTLQPGKRLFLHFGAVNYATDVYLNGSKLGSHEGGFTPFQFEITGKVKVGVNDLVVKVNNARHTDGLPGAGYDWLNYGGITRDVDLVATPGTYIEDYSIQLKKGSFHTVAGRVQLNGMQPAQNITIKIRELNLLYKTRTDENGMAGIEFSANLKLWSPESPKLYKVEIESETDTVVDRVGFRNIEVKGNEILLNGKTVFLKAVNIHEENPYKGTRAWCRQDAVVLLNAAKELGCNLVRLAHYPHSEQMVKEAEKMGLMVWSELPVYQHIKFDTPAVTAKMERMLQEMVRRDKNRCAVVIWSLSNETYPGTPNRTEALVALTQQCRALDSTRLITHVTNSQRYQNNTFEIWDPLYQSSDLISLNEYIGWYVPWQGKPAGTKWNLVCPDKPVFISEFGGEALYGSHYGKADEAAYFTEAYQANIYTAQLQLFNTVPNLCGVCPWLLFDYRSPGRMHPVYQKGYNRKGLLSNKGQKKKAWYIMHAYYSKKHKQTI